MSFQSEINAVIQREVESRTDRNSEVINRQAAILFELRGKLESIEGERDALQQKLDAVVAEGITLRKFIRDSCYVYNGDGGDISDAYGLAEESTLFPRQVETITTINYVRAEGVEILAVDLATPNPELADGTNKINKAMAWYARQFASKMRAADAAKDGV